MVRSNNIFIGSKKNQSNQILQSDDAKITLNDFIAQIQFELKILHWSTLEIEMILIVYWSRQMFVKFGKSQENISGSSDQ